MAHVESEQFRIWDITTNVQQRTGADRAIYHRTIAISNDNAIYGKFGIGETIGEAMNNLRKAGGVIKTAKIVRFVSRLPFVPANDKREAGPHEADAWIDRAGGLNWVRCDRVWLDQ